MTNESKQEDVRGMVYAFRRKGQDAFCTCNKDRYNELSDKPHLFETTVFYTHPADCPRCAELSESINNRAREQAQKAVNNGVYLDKLATLEAEKEEIKQAIRWAPSSAHWSNVLIKLCGEDSRDGINALEKQLREAQTTIAQQAEQLAAAESRLHDVATHCATVEQQLAAAEKAMNRCYKMLLSEPDTKGALFKAENILREALADAVIAAQKGEK